MGHLILNGSPFDYLGLRSGDQNKLFLGDPSGETLRLVTLGRCCYPETKFILKYIVLKYIQIGTLTIEKFNVHLCTT